MAKGKDFEELVEEFYQQLLQKKKQRAVIRRNEIVIDPDGGRECDVTIEHSLGDLTFRTLIECKDHSNPVSFGLMDALASRMTDLKFNKGVMISRSRFQSGSVAKAERLGIDIFTFNKARHQTEEIIRQTPLIHLTVTLLEMAVSFDCNPDISPPLKQISSRLFDQATPAQLYMEHIKPSFETAGEIGRKKMPVEAGYSFQTTSKMNETTFLIQDHYASNVEMLLHCRKDVYIGTLGDIDELYEKVRHGDSSGEIFIPSREIKTLSKKLVRLDGKPEIPNYLKQKTIGTYSIIDGDGFENAGLYELSKVKNTFSANFPFNELPSGKWLRVFGRSAAKKE